MHGGQQHHVIAAFNDLQFESISQRNRTGGGGAAALSVSHTGAQTVNFATLDVITM